MHKKSDCTMKGSTMAMLQVAREMYGRKRSGKASKLQHSIWYVEFFLKPMYEQFLLRYCTVHTVQDVLMKQEKAGKS